MFNLKKIIKETKRLDTENVENSQRVTVSVVMEQVPEVIQSEVERELEDFFKKVEHLVPDKA